MKHSLLLVCLFSGFLAKAAIPEKTIQATITDIQAKGVTNTTAIETGVRQVAHLWPITRWHRLRISRILREKLYYRPGTKTTGIPKGKSLLRGLMGTF